MTGQNKQVRELGKDLWALAADLVTLPLGRGARELYRATIKKDPDPLGAIERVARMHYLEALTGAGIGLATGGGVAGMAAATVGLHLLWTLSAQPFQTTGNPQLPRYAARRTVRAAAVQNG